MDKREQARQHRGVWYDARADKFAADVYSQGKRHFLGLFPTAEEASAAYLLARMELPSGRDTSGSFAAAFNNFLDTAERDEKGTPIEHETFDYDGQTFSFVRLTFRKMGKVKRPFYLWASLCRECGSPYETMTATSAASAKGITRTCEQHRAGRRSAQPAAARPVARERRDTPADAAAVVRAVAEALSLVSDTFSQKAFIVQRQAQFPDTDHEVTGFAFRDPASPIEPVGDGNWRLKK